MREARWEGWEERVQMLVVEMGPVEESLIFLAKGEEEDASGSRGCFFKTDEAGSAASAGATSCSTFAVFSTARPSTSQAIASEEEEEGLTMDMKLGVPRWSRRTGLVTTQASQMKWT